MCLREEGSVSLAVYLTHIKAMGGLLTFLAITLLVSAAQAAIIMSDYWLAFWTEKRLPKHLFVGDEPHKSDSFYLSGLAIISAIAIVVMLIKAVVFAYASTRASVVHHNGVLRSLMHAPMSFFDSVPGRKR
jgi:ATP-binding cassette subfamily C (CFTR/MRP) protein 2